MCVSENISWLEIRITIILFNHRHCNVLFQWKFLNSDRTYSFIYKNTVTITLPLDEFSMIVSKNSSTKLVVIYINYIIVKIHVCEKYMYAKGLLVLLYWEPLSLTTLSGTPNLANIFSRLLMTQLAVFWQSNSILKYFE